MAKGKEVIHEEQKYDVRTYGEVAEVRTLESGGTNIVSGYA